MSSILKRTVFFTQNGDGLIRPYDWAQVITTLGTGAEPHMCGSGHIQTDIDKPNADFENDEIRIIHDLKVVDDSVALQSINGGDEYLSFMGGRHFGRARQ